jgi:hypothetical protein
MKYITTDKHPQLKDGIEVGGFIKGSYLVFTNDGIYTELHLQKCIEKGYIKELQEPEFTKDDLL